MNATKKKFHGASKSLEVSAALSLYQNSAQPDFPFRYTIYVGDGDSNVIKAVTKKNFYGDAFPIVKEECIYHFRKRCRKHIWAVLDNARLYDLKAKHHETKDLNYKTLDLEKDFNVRLPFKHTVDKFKYRFSNLIHFVIKECIKENTKKGDVRSPSAITRMSDSIKAIPRHYMDHAHASLDDRVNKFHKYCRKSFCKFIRLEDDQPKQAAWKPEKDGELYVHEISHKTGKVTTAIMDRIINKFDELGDVSVMARCTRLLNQNVNESLHSRTFAMLKKIKFYIYDHVKFCAQLSGAIHNNGYCKTIGSEYKRYGDFSELEKKQLKHRDNERLYNASDKHQKIKKDSRFVNKPPLKDGENIEYCAGYGFEEYEVSGAAAFDAIQAERDSDLAELESFDNEIDSVATADVAQDSVATADAEAAAGDQYLRFYD